MRYGILFLIFAGFWGSAVHAADTTTMNSLKQYYFVMLTKGPNRDQDAATAAAIQKGHLDNIGRLAEAGKILLSGPFGDDGNWRGLFIFDAASPEEVESLLQTDPAVQAGRLAFEIHPWWSMPGSCLK